MRFRKYLVILAVFLLSVLAVQPVLSEGNFTEGLAARNMTEVLTARNVAGIINQTEELSRDNGTQYYNYGAQSLNIGDLDNALVYFDKALSENTSMLKKTDALQYLFESKAYVLIQKERYADAVATVDEGLSVYPKDPKLWNNRGFALSSLGKQQEALQAYDTAVSIDSNYTKALLNKGDVLIAMGRYPEAVVAYTRANETDPFNINASDGLDAARQGESVSSRNMTLIMAIVLIAATAGIVWYLRFRRPAGPAPEEKRSRSKKKK